VLIISPILDENYGHVTSCSEFFSSHFEINYNKDGLLTIRSEQ